jgi:hypothetical protein
MQWVVPKVGPSQLCDNYVAEALAAGLEHDAYAKLTLFNKCLEHVFKNMMNVRENTFNNVTGGCIECTHWNNIITRARKEGASGETDRLAAVAGMATHWQVVRTGHREGVERYAAKARTPTSDWLAVTIDGMDNVHSSVPWINNHADKGHQSLVRIALKFTGVVEYGAGLHFVGAVPWLHAKSSVSLNFTVIFFVFKRMLARGQPLRRKALFDMDGGDGNYTNAAMVNYALLVKVELVDEVIVHRAPVSHTHNYLDALFSHHSVYTIGSTRTPGHDIKTVEDMSASFEGAYGSLDGDAKLQSNVMLEATYDFQGLAEKFKNDDFNLGGVGTHNFIAGTANVNPQKMREALAVRFRKDATGTKVLVQWLERQDFIDGKRMDVEEDWQSHDIETDSVLRDGVTKVDVIHAMRELFDNPGGWRKIVQSGGAVSEGWKDYARSKSSVLRYAQQHKQDFDDQSVEKLKAFYARVPTTEAEFMSTINGGGLELPSFAGVLDYCESADVGGERARAAIEDHAQAMQINTAGTVSHVRTTSYTEHDRTVESRTIRCEENILSRARIKWG